MRICKWCVCVNSLDKWCSGGVIRDNVRMSFKLIIEHSMDNCHTVAVE